MRDELDEFLALLGQYVTSYAFFSQILTFGDEYFGDEYYPKLSVSADLHLQAGQGGGLQGMTAAGMAPAGAQQHEGGLRARGAGGLRVEPEPPVRGDRQALPGVVLRGADGPGHGVRPVGAAAGGRVGLPRRTCRRCQTAGPTALNL